MKALLVLIFAVVGVFGYHWERSNIKLKPQFKRLEDIDFPVIGFRSDDPRQIVPKIVLHNFGLQSKNYGAFPGLNVTAIELAEVHKEWAFFTLRSNSSNTGAGMGIPVSTLVRVALKVLDKKPELKENVEWILAHGLNSLYALLIEVEGYFGTIAEELYQLKTDQLSEPNCPTSQAIQEGVLGNDCLVEPISDEKWEDIRVYAGVAKEISVTANLLQEMLTENSLTFGVLTGISAAAHEHYAKMSTLFAFFFEHNEIVHTLHDTYRPVKVELFRHLGQFADLFIPMARKNYF